MATEQPIPKLVASLVEHQRKFEVLPSDDAQWVIQNTKDAIDVFVNAILARGGDAQDPFCYSEDDLIIRIPARPRPTLDELRKQFSWITEIERDTSPTGPVRFCLATVLRANERPISGEEYGRRIALALHRLLGLQHCEWLMAYQDRYPAFKALPGSLYIDFPGLVVVGSDGHRYIPLGRFDGGRWALSFGLLNFSSHSGCRVAISSPSIRA